MTLRSLAGLAVAAVVTTAPLHAQDSTQQVRGAVEQYRVAYLGCKADVLGTLLTPDFDAAVAPGTVMGRDVMLKAVAGCLVDKLTFETTSLRVYGDQTAVVRLLWTETPKGTPKPMPYVVTQVFVKQNGKWMLATQQGTTAASK